MDKRNNDGGGDRYVRIGASICQAQIPANDPVFETCQIKWECCLALKPEGESGGSTVAMGDSAVNKPPQRFAIAPDLPSKMGIHLVEGTRSAGVRTRHNLGITPKTHRLRCPLALSSSA